MIKIPRTSAPYITKVRPPTEPYEFWVARRRAQQKDLKKYLRGFPVWRSSLLIDTRKYPLGKPSKKDLKKIPLQGTYVSPLCPLCMRKEKRCKCLSLL